MALYVDDELMKRLDRAAKLAKMSRSRFVAEALRQRLDERLPESFFEVLGSWVDERGPEQILRDIRRVPRDRRVRVR
ncbi:MAG: ribbon-helix-helix protein, CopG family [Myxococcaceae bacterium]